MNTFLDLVGKKLNQSRIVLPDNINHVVEFRKRDKSYSAIWFKTKGCRYSYNGGCTMCDYFISKEVPNEDMLNYFIEGMDELPEQPDLMVVQTSGSFFDKEEVPESVRIKIYEVLRERLPNTVLVFETHISTITEETVDQLLEYFSPERVQIEFGVETSDEWIRKYCVNKCISNEQIEKAIKILNKRNIAALANVVIGIPFLSLKENIDSASNTIKWGIQNGITSMCLFPVNLKPFTLVHWMDQHNLYRQPSLWALVDVIAGVRKIFLPRVDTNWYRRTAKMDNPLYTTSIQGPYSCDCCNDTVVKLLDRYNLDDADRAGIINEINLLECECRNEYKIELKNEESIPLKERVKKQYKFIGDELFGNEFWNAETIKLLDI
jgi:radical SAM enzyme (TIGR01210 family)